MARIWKLRSWATSAAVIAIAAVVIGDASATATQGSAVIAGQTNTSTADTVVQDTYYSVPCSPVLAAGLLACGSIGLEGNGNTYGVYGGGDDTGVYGVSSGGNGVFGYSSGTGNGVDGFVNSSTASGVYGENGSSGFGVAGRANGGVGVLADSTSGTALEVNGKAQFSRSGVVTISYPAKTAVISAVPLTAKSLVFATEQRFLAGVYVVAAVPNLSGSSNSFTIYLNKTPGTSTSPKSVTVGWYVIERS